MEVLYYGIKTRYAYDCPLCFPHELLMSLGNICMYIYITHKYWNLDKRVFIWKCILLLLVLLRSFFYTTTRCIGWGKRVHGFRKRRWKLIVFKLCSDMKIWLNYFAENVIFVDGSDVNPGICVIVKTCSYRHTANVSLLKSMHGLCVY